MAYKGQPVPSSVHNIGYGKISDGKSVKVTVPESTTIEAGKFTCWTVFLVALCSLWKPVQEKPQK